nr:hypothetical protein [Tanacetum cinerariifolium]
MSTWQESKDEAQMDGQDQKRAEYSRNSVMVAVNHVMDIIVNHEPSYNQNYDDNYYPHKSLSYPCCDYCGGSHETFQCQPDTQNVDFSGSDRIQTPQYPDVNPPSPEISNEEIFQAKGDFMKSIQTFLESFNCIPFEEKPQILFQTRKTFFAIQCSQPEDLNELFQKLLKDLKELAEYDQSTSTNRPIFLNDNEDHPVQNRESPENSSEETFVSKTNQEAPHDSYIHQLIDECFVEVPEEQKQNMEKTMLDLVKICHHKQFLCMHDNVDDLIESALDSKLLSINSINFQCLDKKEQEVKIVEEQPAERRNHIEKSLKNFRVIHKSSISLNTSQISSIHEVAPILSTKEPENSLSMGYEHLSITPETEVTESNAKNLLPIPSECEVTLEGKRECDELICENSSTVDVDASVPNPTIANVEENVDHQEQEEINLEEISQVQDVVLREKLLSITHLISNIESLNDNSTLDRVFNSFESDNSLLDNFSPEFETFCDNSEETRSGNTTHANYSLPEYDLFCFEIEPDQERLINLVENVIPDNSSNDPLLEEVNLFLVSDNSIPPGIENVADDPEGDIQPPDDNFDLEPEVISAVMEDIDEPDEHFNPGREINVSTKIEEDDYFPFMFVI